MVTSDLRAKVELWLFRACAMYPAIIIGTLCSLRTWLCGRYHVPQTVFLVYINICCLSILFRHGVSNFIQICQCTAKLWHHIYFPTWAPSSRKSSSGFSFSDHTRLGMSKSISTPNFDTSIRCWVITTSSFWRLPYWNSASGFNVDLFIIMGMAFYIGVPISSKSVSVGRSYGRHLEKLIWHHKSTHRNLLSMRAGIWPLQLCVCVCVLLGADIGTNVLSRLRDALREMIDPDFMLPMELLSQDVLSDEDRQKVERKDTYQERNDTLLNMVLQKSDVDLAVLQFTGCLRDTDQDHVYNFIRCNGGKQYCGLFVFSHCIWQWYWLILVRRVLCGAALHCVVIKQH